MANENKKISQLGTLSIAQAADQYAVNRAGASKRVTMGNTTQTLSAASTAVAWAMAVNQVATITLDGNKSMSSPSNIVEGQEYYLQVIQDGTGGRTLTWATEFNWIGGTAPTLSTAAAARDRISFIADGSTNLDAIVVAKGFST